MPRSARETVRPSAYDFDGRLFPPVVGNCFNLCFGLAGSANFAYPAASGRHARLAWCASVHGLHRVARGFHHTGTHDMALATAWLACNSPGLIQRSTLAFAR